MNGKLTEYRAAAPASLRSVRLVDSNGAQLVLMDVPGEAAPGFLLAPAGASGPWRALENVSPRAKSGWDAAPSGGGALRFVFSNPESATKWLSLVQSADGDSKMVTGDYDRGFFGAPRFVRREEATAITSVAAVDGQARLVSFAPAANGEFGAYRLLPVLNEGGLGDGLLIRTRDGYLALARILTGSGARNPGLLYCAEWNAAFEVMRAARLCLGNQSIFEFDADAAGGRLVIFAATAAGYVIASGSPGALQIEEHESEAVTSPSVLLQGTEAHLAAIRAGKVVTGSVAVKESGK